MALLAVKPRQHQYHAQSNKEKDIHGATGSRGEPPPIDKHLGQLDQDPCGSQVRQRPLDELRALQSIDERGQS